MHACMHSPLHGPHLRLFPSSLFLLHPPMFFASPSTQKHTHSSTHACIPFTWFLSLSFFLNPSIFAFPPHTLCHACMHSFHMILFSFFLSSSTHAPSFILPRMHLHHHHHRHHLFCFPSRRSWFLSVQCPSPFSQHFVTRIPKSPIESTVFVTIRYKMLIHGKMASVPFPYRNGLLSYCPVFHRSMAQLFVTRSLRKKNVDRMRERSRLRIEQVSMDRFDRGTNEDVDSQTTMDV